MIVKDDSRVINMLEASLTDGATAFIYDCQMFIVQAIGLLYKSNVQASLVKGNLKMGLETNFMIIYAQYYISKHRWQHNIA